MPKYKEEFAVLGTIVTVDESKKLKLKSTDYYQSRLDKLPEGKEVQVIVSTKTPTRSQAQMGYYFIIMGYLAEYTGFTKSEMHDATMKLKFGFKTVRIGSREVQVRRSISDTAKFPKHRMVELIEFALELCAENDINVPTPESLGYISN